MKRFLKASVFGLACLLMIGILIIPWTLFASPYNYIGASLTLYIVATIGIYLEPGYKKNKE